MRRPKTFSQLFLKANWATGMGGLMDATKLIQRTLFNPVTAPGLNDLMRPLQSPAKVRRSGARAAQPAAAKADIRDVVTGDLPLAAEAPVAPKPRRASFS